MGKSRKSEKVENWTKLEFRRNMKSEKVEIGKRRKSKKGISEKVGNHNRSIKKIN